MSINSIFQFFIPKGNSFFKLFDEASNNLMSIAQKLVEACNENDIEKRKLIIKEIEVYERKGDEITHQIFIELSKNFITPFDREDIHALASAIDDIADFIHGSANRMVLYNLTKVTEPIKQLAQLTLDGVTSLRKAIIELKDLKNISNITDACVRINSIENQADNVFDKAVADLFDFESNALELIKQKEILQAIETATDKCEDAVNVLETIIIKYA
jgi:uncharacterized protein